MRGNNKHTPCRKALGTGRLQRLTDDNEHRTAQHFHVHILRMLVRRYSRPPFDLKLILEGPRPAGIANQIAAEHARDVFMRLPLIPADGVGLRSAGTRKVAQQQRKKRQGDYTDWFFHHRDDAEIAEDLKSRQRLFYWKK